MLNPYTHIAGNEPIKGYLSRIVERGTIPQAVLFAGPEGAEKELFAKNFAKAVLGTNNDSHPDLRIYKPEGKIGQHSIQTMRQFCEEVYLAPFEAKRKVFIIHDAHRMLSYSANALLKTFEEPSLDSVIILISHAPDQILPTVLSRCQIIRFSLTHQQKQESDPLRTLILDSLARGAFADYLEMLQLVKEITQQMESGLKEREKTLRTQLQEAFNDKMSALQTQAMEKDVEGAIALQRSLAMQSVFDAVLGWYRDVQLLHVGGAPSLLMNSDYEDALTQALQRGSLLPLDKVLEAVKKASLMLERSAPINYCLEHLFLALQK